MGFSPDHTRKTKPGKLVDKIEREKKEVALSVGLMSLEQDRSQSLRETKIPQECT